MNLGGTPRQKGFRKGGQKEEKTKHVIENNQKRRPIPLAGKSIILRQAAKKITNPGGGKKRTQHSGSGQKGKSMQNPFRCPGKRKNKAKSTIRRGRSGSKNNNQKKKKQIPNDTARKQTGGGVTDDLKGRATGETKHERDKLTAGEKRANNREKEEG